MEKPKKLKLSKRDIGILLNLWKFQALSVNAVHAVCYPGHTRLAAYRRLSLLRRHDYIKPMYLGSLYNLCWTLTARGFSKIKKYLPELRRNGYSTDSVHHNFMATAVQLGNWVNGYPPGADIVTGQELMRFHQHDLPSWAPYCPNYAPDGCWHINNRTTKLLQVLEVEEPRRTNKRVHKIIKYYQQHPEIDRVVWIMPSGASAKSLQRKLERALPDRARSHQFLTHSKILSKNWNAKINLGNQYGETLNSLLMNSGCTWGVIGAKSMSDLYLLETKL